jgi:DNA-binding NtrC family response regulator
VHVAASIDDLCKRLGSDEPYDLVAVDFVLGDGTGGGAEAFRAVRKIDPEVPLIAVAEAGNVEVAASAIRAGATDFLVRGHNLAERVTTLLGKVSNLLKLIRNNRILDTYNKLLMQEAGARYEIVGESEPMRRVVEQIERVAKVPRPVLITGERGTGKELVARAIHAAAGKPGRPIVVVNCAAFPDTLLESELFGHEKGAFTGADSLARGKFEQADSGTLFLDEIGNMTLPFQRKILRVVEYKCFTRVGGTAEIKTSARIIAATNVNLKERMGQGGFLRDLYDRLSFEIIRVPALREREGDVEVLARHFLKRFMQEIPAFRGKRLSKAALDALNGYGFPGNVRELKNIIERAAYRDTTNEITPEDIGMLRPAEQAAPGGTFSEKVDSFSSRLLGDALADTSGNQAAAARLLGLSYHQFRYYHKKYLS